ncbi:MAG: hypothetical protein ACFFAH_13550 [Promethearchaeota archaeon]
MSSGVIKKEYAAILESNPPPNILSSFNKNEYDYNIDQFSKKDKKICLELLKKNHSIFLNCKDLTHKQKIDFCSFERYMMKIYLKEVLSKLV